MPSTTCSKRDSLHLNGSSFSVIFFRMCWPLKSLMSDTSSAGESAATKGYWIFLVKASLEY